MANEPDNIVLVYPRRIDEMLDRVIEGVNLEESAAKIELWSAGINRWIDKVAGRLDRIERRLDLADASH